MDQIKLNTIQIVHMPHYEKLLIQIVNMAHICENDMIQLKDMFQIVATWLQFSTEEYVTGGVNLRGTWQLFKKFFWTFFEKYSFLWIFSGCSLQPGLRCAVRPSLLEVLLRAGGSWGVLPTGVLWARLRQVPEGGSHWPPLHRGVQRSQQWRDQDRLSLWCFERKIAHKERSAPKDENTLEFCLFLTLSVKSIKNCAKKLFKVKHPYPRCLRWL